jgi:hypothetical protein
MLCNDNEAITIHGYTGFQVEMKSSIMLVYVQATEQMQFIFEYVQRWLAPCVLPFD